MGWFRRPKAPEPQPLDAAFEAILSGETPLARRWVEGGGTHDGLETLAARGRIAVGSYCVATDGLLREPTWLDVLEIYTMGLGVADLLAQVVVNIRGDARTASEALEVAMIGLFAASVLADPRACDQAQRADMVDQISGWLGPVLPGEVGTLFEYAVRQDMSAGFDDFDWLAEVWLVILAVGSDAPVAPYRAIAGVPMIVLPWVESVTEARRYSPTRA